VVGSHSPKDAQGAERQPQPHPNPAIDDVFSLFKLGSLVRGKFRYLQGGVRVRELRVRVRLGVGGLG